MKMKRILDVGCGKEKVKVKGAKVIGIDRVKLPGVDVIHDLEKTPLPFPDNYFDEIICNHVLEHINNLFNLMEEFYRIIKPNGLLKIRVPYFASPSAFMHPDHKRFFTYKTFDYWLPNEKQRYEVSRNASFIYKERKLIFDKKFRVFGLEMIANSFPNFYEVILSRIFPAGEIYIELIPLK